MSRGLSTLVDVEHVLLTCRYIIHRQYHQVKRMILELSTLVYVEHVLLTCRYILPKQYHQVRRMILELSTLVGVEHILLSCKLWDVGCSKLQLTKVHSSL